MANALGNVSAQSYFLKTPDFFMIGQERELHNEAVYAYGEYAMFTLMWNAIDYAAGIVQHCPNCYSTNDGVSDAYNQPSYTKCSYCYGTTFFLLSAGVEGLGGLKARIVRPCLWNPTDESQKQTKTGEIITSTSSVQSISDFRMRTSDYVLKADGTRWRIATHSTDSIISGFQAANDVRAMIGYNYGQAVREDESMPVFLIPVGPGTEAGNQVTLLDTSVIPNYPVDFSAYEVVNGPLIGDDASNKDFVQPAPVEGN